MDEIVSKVIVITIDTKVIENCRLPHGNIDSVQIWTNVLTSDRQMVYKCMFS